MAVSYISGVKTFIIYFGKYRRFAGYVLHKLGKFLFVINIVD